MNKTVGQWLQRAARAHRALVADAVSDLGLFPGQELTVQTLAAGKIATVGQLAEELNVRAPTISKTLQRLAAQGLIERRDHESDARRSTVVLTKAGVKLARELESRMEKVEANLIEALDSKDQRRLRKLLRRVARSQTPDENPAEEDDGE